MKLKYRFTKLKHQFTKLNYQSQSITIADFVEHLTVKLKYQFIKVFDITAAKRNIQPLTYININFVSNIMVFT